MQNYNTSVPQGGTKFCTHCGATIPYTAVVCTQCGNQVAPLQYQQPSVVVNNINTNAVIMPGMRRKDKWLAFLLCLLLGYLGAHKFYEGKAGMGILYLLTFGLLGIGWLVDCIVLLCKPNPYYVQ